MINDETRISQLVADLKGFLDEKADFYNNPEFIENDPIQIPHRFSLKQDVEIAGFLTATISWGSDAHGVRCDRRLAGRPARRHPEVPV